VLEDLTAQYSQPCILDVKVRHQLLFQRSMLCSRHLRLLALRCMACAVRFTVKGCTPWSCCVCDNDFIRLHLPALLPAYLLCSWASALGTPGQVTACSRSTGEAQHQGGEKYR
jgi:hypothetical protein